VLFRFAACREYTVATMQSVLGTPGEVDDRRRRAALAQPQRASEKRMMAVLPGGFDENAAEGRVARFGDRPARLFSAAGVL
jgi:hypothetical protein